MVAYLYSPEDFGPRPNGHVPPDERHLRTVFTCSNRHLLKKDAVGSDMGFRMDNNAIGVKKEHAAANSGSQRDIGP